MKRGEVWWANLPPPANRRPVLLVSRDEVYYIRKSITIALLTTTIRNIKTNIQLGPEDGLPQTSIVNCDDLTTISKKLLINKITSLNPFKLHLVNQAIKFALDLE